MCCIKNMCCLDLTIGARLIGILGLLLAVIVVPQLLTELIHGNGDGKIAILIGWDVNVFYMSNRSFIDSLLSDKEEEVKGTYVFVVCSFVFAVFQIITNFLLIFATITEKSWCTIPWFIYEGINFIVQVGGLLIYLRNMWGKTQDFVTTAAIFHMALSIYFMLLVYWATKHWRGHVEHEEIGRVVNT